MINDYLNDALRFLKKQGITKGEVAKTLGITPGYISQMIAGDKPVTENFIKQFKREYSKLIPGDIINKLTKSVLEDFKAKVIAANFMSLRIQAQMPVEEFFHSMEYLSGWEDVKRLENSKVDIDKYHFIAIAKEFMAKQNGQYSNEQIENFDKKYLDTSKELAEEFLILRKQTEDLKKPSNVVTMGHTDELSQVAEPAVPLEKKRKK